MAAADPLCSPGDEKPPDDPFDEAREIGSSLVAAGTAESLTRTFPAPFTATLPSGLVMAIVN